MDNEQKKALAKLTDAEVQQEIDMDNAWMLSATPEEIADITGEPVTMERKDYLRMWSGLRDQEVVSREFAALLDEKYKEIAALEEENKALREALAPFHEIYGHWLSRNTIEVYFDSWLAQYVQLDKYRRVVRHWFETLSDVLYEYDQKRLK